MAIVKHISNWNNETKSYDPDTVQTLFTGCVLRTYQGDHRAMSDVYTWATFAEVWNDELKIVQKVLVNANFECDVSGDYAEVDATRVTKLKVRLYGIKAKIAANKLEVIKRDAVEKKAVRVGRIMRVTRGRKVKPGTEGVVAYIYGGDRALLKDPMSDWRNRNTPGQWVSCDYLEGID